MLLLFLALCNWDISNLVLLFKFSLVLSIIQHDCLANHSMQSRKFICMNYLVLYHILQFSIQLCCKSWVISFDLCCDWLKRSNVLECWFWLLNIIQLSFDDSFCIYVFIHSLYCLLKVKKVFKNSVDFIFLIFWLILQVISYQWFKSFEDIFFEVRECKQYLVMR